MKKSGVRRGVLVYKGPDPAGKMEIPVDFSAYCKRQEIRKLALRFRQPTWKQSR